MVRLQNIMEFKKLFPIKYMVARETAIQQTIRKAALKHGVLPDEKSHIKPAIIPNAMAYPSRSCMETATENATIKTGRISNIPRKEKVV